MNRDRIQRTTVIGSILTAVAASACCIGPLILLSLGIGGAWVGALTALEPYRPWFLGIAIALIIIAGVQIWRRRRAACPVDSLCADPRGSRFYLMFFWIAVILIAIAAFSPVLAPLFY